MTDNFNHVTCPKCGYEENSISAQKCEICGQALKKSNSLTPIIAGVGAVAMLGGLGYFGYNMFTSMKGEKCSCRSDRSPATTDTQPAAQPTAQPVAATPNDTPASSPSADVSTALSWGERVLFTDAPNADMQAGATAFAAGDYATASAKFAAVRQAVRNDPEALIYLNNAQIGTGPALGIAAVVPIDDTPQCGSGIAEGRSPGPGRSHPGGSAD